MRTFIAVELPEDIRAALSRLQDRLKQSQADVKWVAPENIHLTLKFLGEIDEKTLQEVKEILADSVKEKDSFAIRLSSLGAFPKIRYPRVIWVGIDKGDSETKEIAQGLEEKIAKLGIPREDRPFSSHITIGRVRSQLNREKLVQNLENAMPEFAAENLEFNVKRVTLFKSTLTPKGPVYEIQTAASLKTI